jgi:hypothetical protein
MRPSNPTRKILEKIKAEQFKLDTAIANGDNRARDKADRNIRNLRKDLAKLNEEN